MTKAASSTDSNIWDVDYSTVPAFRYDGGKATIRPWIMRFVPGRGRLFLEPFAGRGNLFFIAAACSDYKRWQINDIRTGQPIKPPTPGFLSALVSVDVSQIPYHVRKEDEAEWRKMYAEGSALAAVMDTALFRNGSGYESDVEFQGSGVNAGDAEDNYTTYTRLGIITRILQARALLLKTSCEITCLDYLQLPWDDYTAEDFAYIDPPYINADVAAYNLKRFDPEQFCKTVKQTKCRCLISEYDHPLYRKYFGPPVATYFTRNTMDPTGNRAHRLECLYANFPVRFRRFRFTDRKEAVLPVVAELLRKHKSLLTEALEQRIEKDLPGLTAAQRLRQVHELRYHPDVYYNGKAYVWCGK